MGDIVTNSVSTLLSTQVKCKNCEAFSHMAMSKMCPMEHWDEALPVQILGSNKEKEKLKTVNAQKLQPPGIFKNTEGEEKEQKM